jgi:hypothetical protein
LRDVAFSVDVIQMGYYVLAGRNTTGLWLNDLLHHFTSKCHVTGSCTGFDLATLRSDQVLLRIMTQTVTDYGNQDVFLMCWRMLP